MLAETLLSAGIATRAKVVPPGALDPRSEPAGSKLILDCQSLAVPFVLAGRIRDENRALGLVLHVEAASDYLLLRARSSGCHAVVSSSDTAKAWADALDRARDGVFHVAPGARPSDQERFLQHLTDRQRAVYELTVHGYDDAWIAERLGIAESTVEKHRSLVMKNLSCPSGLHLLVHAMKHGVLTPATLRFPPNMKLNSRPHCARAEPPPVR
jgi:DNA-binding NarL/FixJ family response regulator